MRSFRLELKDEKALIQILTKPMLSFKAKQAKTFV